MSFAQMSLKHIHKPSLKMWFNLLVIWVCGNSKFSHCTKFDCLSRYQNHHKKRLQWVEVAKIVLKWSFCNFKCFSWKCANVFFYRKSFFSVLGVLVNLPLHRSIKYDVQRATDVVIMWDKPVNTKGGSITVLLTSCLTGLESAVWQLKNFVFISKTD
jgi:hypothetical protein